MSRSLGGDRERRGDLLRARCGRTTPAADCDRATLYPPLCISEKKNVNHFLFCVIYRIRKYTLYTKQLNSFKENYNIIRYQIKNLLTEYVNTLYFISSYCVKYL